MKIRQMKIHGTYPYDSFKWSHVRDITREEAAKLVNAPQELIDDREGDKRYPRYLWMNKGYIVLNQPHMESARTEPGLVYALLESVMTDMEPKGIPVGSEAVYLHDGNYSIIKKVR